MTEKHTYEDAYTVNAILGLVKNTNLSNESFVKLYKLKKNVKSHIDDLTALQRELMEKHGIEEANGQFSYTDHPAKAQINKEFLGLLKTEISIEPHNFIPINELKEATKDQSINDVSFLIDIIGQI